MTTIRNLFASPLWSRVAPFAIYLILTACQGLPGESSRFWFYVVKTLVAVWLLWVTWPVVAEMRWKVSWEALAVGVGVFVIWVGMDGYYPPLNELLSHVGLGGSDTPAKAWNPPAHFGEGSALALVFVAARIAGSTLVVPPLEEVFFRSFVYRYVAKPDFLSVPLGQFAWTPFLVTSALFAVEHREWLPGLLCGFAYQGLVCWKKRLGDAMTAHAVTNLLLGLWVVGRGAWHFW